MLSFKNKQKSLTFIKTEPVKKACKSIDIRTPNLNEPAIIKALKKSLKNKVSIRIVMPLGFNDNTSFSFIRGRVINLRTATEQMNWAQKKGLDRFLYISWHAAKDGSVTDRPHEYGESSLVKYLCVDDQFISMGSFNFDS